MSNGKNKQDAQARRRLQIWNAKKTVHEQQTQRRRKDNLLAATVGGSLIVIAIVAQTLYFTVGPGKAVDQAAAPSASASPAVEPSPSASPAEEGTETEDAQTAPDPALSENRTWTGQIVLNGEPISVELFGDLAPQAVSSFVSLTQEGYFDNTECHRLTTAGIYVLQCGDPDGTGTGGPGYSFGPVENAPQDDVYAQGTLAMARVSGDGNSMGSQFFIVYDESTIPSDAAGGYTVFGRVTDGLTVLAPVIAGGDEAGTGDGKPLVPATITSISVE